MLNRRVSELCKENVLGTFYYLTAYFHRSAYGCLPERKIEHMVESEWDQKSFHQTIDPGSCVTGFQNHISYCVDSCLDDRPDEVHQNTNTCVNKSGDNRNESCTTEEGQYLRQFNFIEPVVQCRNTQTYNNTAEYTHL